jgi:hypothetical protein
VEVKGFQFLLECPIFLEGVTRRRTPYAYVLRRHFRRRLFVVIEFTTSDFCGWVDIRGHLPPPEEVMNHSTRARYLLQMKTIDKIVGTLPHFFAAT